MIHITRLARRLSYRWDGHRLTIVTPAGICRLTGEEARALHDALAYVADPAMLADVVAEYVSDNEMAERIGNVWYTDDAEYRVKGSSVYRSDGSHAVFEGEDEALLAAESLARGRAADDEYEWLDETAIERESP